MNRKPYFDDSSLFIATSRLALNPTFSGTAPGASSDAWATARHLTALALRAWAIAFERWRVSRQRKAQARQDLANMGERELRDIGLSPGDVSTAAEKSWSRGSSL
jgi:uncharacterized protein YjiS (DUF1127 family)